MVQVAPGSSYFPAPYSLLHLTPDLKHGLWAPGLLGLVSVIATTALLCFLVYRFTMWRKYYKTFVGYNQYVVLIMNLLIADFCQGLSFLFTFHWLSVDGILTPTPQCSAQGFLLNIGDLASGFFILAIALHTFNTAVRGRRIEHYTFIGCILAVWAFALLLSVIGPGLHGNKYFVQTGAWCWASGDYERDRLALHYIWIFTVEFGIIVIYLAIFLHLKRALRHMLPAVRTQSGAHSKVDRAAKLMVLYPFFYILLTLPLSAGRMWSAAHSDTELPNKFQCVAGAMIASCGWVDALLYTLTRRTLIVGSSPHDDVRSDRPSGEGKGNSGVVKESSSLSCGGITQTRTVTVAHDEMELEIIEEVVDVEKGRGRSSRREFGGFHMSARSQSGSLEPIVNGQGHMGVDPEREKRGNSVFVSTVDVESSSDDERSGEDSLRESGRRGRN